MLRLGRRSTLDKSYLSPFAWTLIGGSVVRAILLYPLFNALLLIYALLPGQDFGLAIIVLTILIRILLWPLVKKQLQHQKVMKELQPEIAKIKAKAKGDRQKESVLMVELFKSKGVNPFGSIGLAFLQIPILIALFFVLRQIVDPAKVAEIAYDFVAGLGPIQSIINNPASWQPNFLGLVDMAKPNLTLAVAAGITQYFQAKQLAPAQPDKSSPTAQLGSSLNLILPVVTVVFAASLPSALALYWAASSLVATLQQQWVLNDQVKWMQRFWNRRGQTNDARQ